MSALSTRILILALPLLAACHLQQTAYEPVRTPILSQQELEAQPELLGGIYFAYPGPQQEVLTPAPEGYTPVYVSHYGRHGSRYQPNDQRYLAPMQLLENQETLGNLTPLAQDVLQRLQHLWPMVEGRGGQLSAIGEEQHRALAQRLYARCPEVFADRKHVDARSSVVPRCAASMQSFCESLQEQDGSLHISLTTDSADMAYIAYDSPAFKALDSDTAAWRIGYKTFCHEVIHPERLMATLLSDTLTLADTPAERSAISSEFMTQLYWLAVGMQDIPADSLTLMDLFTTSELFDLWRTVNYRMYMTCGPCPDNGGIPADCARPLLSHIIDEAHAALASDTIAAHLRFGHDSNLLRLLTLIHADGAATAVTDDHKRWQVWQEPILSPMAANLQILFYRSTHAEAPILVKFLLNERELLLDLGLDPVTGPYYDWSALSTLFRNTCL